MNREEINRLIDRSNLKNIVAENILQGKDIKITKSRDGIKIYATKTKSITEIK